MGNTSSRYLIARLFREYMYPERQKLIIAIIAMIIIALCTGSLAYLMEPMLDKVFVQKNQELLFFLPIIVVSVFLIRGVAAYIESFLMTTLGQSIVIKAQLQLYGHLLTADLGAVQQDGSGTLISRFTHDIQLMRGAVSNLLTSAVKEGLTLICLIGVMFYTSLELAIIAFIVFPIAIYPILRLGKRMRKISRNTQENIGDFTSQLDDTFQGIRMVKAYQREAFEVDKATTIVEKLYTLYAKSARTQALTSPIMETLSGVAIAAVIWYGGTKVMADATTPGAFFAFITAFMLAYRPLKSLSNLNTALQEGLAAAVRFFHIIDQQPTIRDQKNAKPLIIDKGHISMRNVHFTYDPPNKALDHITIDIAAGKTVALVGPSGSGKSTIMNLILRFYDPSEGEIFIDGQDIKKGTLDSLRQSIAIVSQEATLFDDTIRANICYGKADATDEEMIQAAYHAAAHEFISELPQGYDTEIGQDGLKLSGGQRQRIAIARAMIRNSPILLLDEATSALDPVSEKQIQRALNTLMHNRTTLVIAHRLSTIEHADKIYVIDKGRVSESGTHQELIKHKGTYANFYAQQLQDNPSHKDEERIELVEGDR